MLLLFFGGGGGGVERVGRRLKSDRETETKEERREKERERERETETETETEREREYLLPVSQFYSNYLINTRDVVVASCQFYSN